MKRISRHPACAGFTLVELTIVLVIVGLLIGGLLVPLSAQRELQDSRETRKQLSDISEALLGYAASHRAADDGNPHLPCPDTDGDGFENRAGDACAAPEGRLPWADLGVGREDAWGNRFRYRVAPAYSDKRIGFTFDSTAPLRVCENPACTTVIANGLPAVIVSHGKNGAGAFNASGGTNPPPAGADEISNQNTGNDFVMHAPSTVAGNEFDDFVIWISRHILFNRMVAAGRLP